MPKKFLPSASFSLITNPLSNIVCLIISAITIAIISALATWALLIFSSPQLTLAQSFSDYPTPPPLPRETTVSVTMPDIVPPTAPILISPENNELVNTNHPQFVWLESTDNVAMSHYQLTLNGSLAIDNISTPGSYELYDLSYNATLGYYYLDLNFDLNEGSHTWKVTAVDAVGLTNDSVTWSFTVDSLPPYFVLTDIGEVEVSISAQDTSTVPEEPIQLAHNEPLLVAYGEPYSLVQLTMQIPGRDDYYRETQIDGHGDWSFQLPILPRDQVITLSFVIIDLARHISVLDDVKIIIPTTVIIIPPPTITEPITPWPTVPPYLSPTPLTTPLPTTLITPIATPTPPDVVEPEPIKIPIKPPKEIVYDLIRFLTPTPVWEAAARPRFQRWLQFFGPWLALLIVSWPAISATFLLARKFGFLVSGKHLVAIWQALGVIPYEDREGLVFDSRWAEWCSGTAFESNNAESADQGIEQAPESALSVDNSLELGIAFAQVTALSQPDDPSFPPFYQTVMTDSLGLYLPLKLPLNTYRLSVQAEDYRYPTKYQRPEQVPLIDFYQAEAQEVTIDRASLSLQIPMDVLSDQTVQLKPYRSWLNKLQLWLAKIIVFNNLLVLLNIMLAGVVILFWPSAVNSLSLGLYLIFGLYYLFKKRLFANIQGVVVNKNGEFVQNALVRLVKQDGSRQTFANLTDDNGRFYFYFKSGAYKLKANKPGQVYNSHSASEQFEEEVQVDGVWQQRRVALLKR